MHIQFYIYMMRLLGLCPVITAPLGDKSIDNELEKMNFE